MKLVTKALTVCLFVLSLASCSVEELNDEQTINEIEATGGDSTIEVDNTRD